MRMRKIVVKRIIRGLKRDQKQRLQLVQLNRSHCLQSKRQQKPDYLSTDSVDIMVTVDSYVDSQHSLFIQALSHKQYEVQDVPHLLRLIQSQSCLGWYQALIGLYALRGRFLRPNNEIEVLGSGLVPALSNLILKSDHPFLQLRAVNLLQILANELTSQAFNLFMTPVLIPLPSLLTLLSSNVQFVLHGALKLLSSLMDHGYPIQSNSSSIDLLVALQKLLLSSGNYTRCDIVRLLMKFRLQFWPSRKPINQHLFCILRKSIILLADQKYISFINNIVYWITSKRTIKRLSYLIDPEERFIQEYPELNQFLALFFTFEIAELPFSTVANFLIKFVSDKRASTLFFRFNTRQKLEHAFVQSQKEQDQLALIELYSQLLIQAPQPQFESLLSNKTFLKVLVVLYRSQEKKTIKQLNGIIMGFLKLYKKCDLGPILIQTKLLDEYIQRAGHFDAQTGKVAMRRLMIELQKMDTQSEQTKNIVACLLKETNYRHMFNVLVNNYLNGCHQILVFFRNLRENPQALQQKNDPQEIQQESEALSAQVIAESN